MPTFVQILDFIGTFAFAISGIRLASAKRFDWFGAYVVGLATAIGTGITAEPEYAEKCIVVPMYGSKV